MTQSERDREPAINAPERAEEPVSEGGQGRAPGSEEAEQDAGLASPKAERNTSVSSEPYGAGSPPPSPEEREEQEAESELRDEMDALQAEFDSLNERHLRLAAEFQNYRRRAEEEMGGTWSRAQADLVRRFLDVLDDLQRVSGLEPESASVEAIVEGVDLVERKFVRALEEAGIEVLDPADAQFDPQLMEAVMLVPTDSAEEDEPGRPRCFSGATCSRATSSVPRG